MSQYCVISKYIQYRFMINCSTVSLIFASFSGCKTMISHSIPWGIRAISPQKYMRGVTVIATFGQYNPTVIVLWKKQNICSLAISELCGKWVSTQFKVAGVRTIPALSRIRATSANRPVCNAWGWEFQWGWGFRVNKQCGGLCGRRAPLSLGFGPAFCCL